MSSIQINAILYLLLAFGVPQSTVDNVQGILNRAGSMPSVTQDQSIPIENTGGIGGESGAATQVPPLTVVQDCTPTLTASVTKVDGQISTGIDFRFNGTSTLPVGCSLDTSLENDLKMQGFPNDLTYHGKISDWGKGSHLTYIPNGFTFYQGWGTGSDVPPVGSFIWSVAGTSTTINIDYR